MRGASAHSSWDTTCLNGVLGLVRVSGVFLSLQRGHKRNEKPLGVRVPDVLDILEGRLEPPSTLSRPLVASNSHDKRQPIEIEIQQPEARAEGQARGMLCIA